ncbi:unnamed protein product [Owenia fusiformis]|uniref:Uncharacterized protein n=1 Tax=Owenia fusiformis TaxID=6347 RepID=A0A8J1UUY4_OWEFU|nr:unnamed protein product [Owenia fusiformis]
MSHLVDDSEAVVGKEPNNIQEDTDGSVIDNSEASGRDYKVDPEFLREQNILALELLILSIVFIIFLCFLGILKKHFLARGWCLWCLSEGAKLKHIASLSSIGTTQSDSNTFLNRVYSTDDMLAAWGSGAYNDAVRRSIVAYNDAARRSIVAYNESTQWDGEENDDTKNDDDGENSDSSKTIITNNKGMMGRRVSFSMDFDVDGDIDVQSKKDIDQNRPNDLEIITEHA